MGMDASDVVILNTSHLQVNCSLQTGYNTDNEQRHSNWPTCNSECLYSFKRNESMNSCGITVFYCLNVEASGRTKSVFKVSEQLSDKRVIK